MICENLFLIIILIIFFIFYFLNKFLNKTIENYGIYCGRYNIDKINSQKNCTNDVECVWNNYISQEGKSAGWCGQNPSRSGNGIIDVEEKVKSNEVYDFYKSVLNGDMFNKS